MSKEVKGVKKRVGGTDEQTHTEKVSLGSSSQDVRGILAKLQGKSPNTPLKEEKVVIPKEEKQKRKGTPKNVQVENSVNIQKEVGEEERSEFEQFLDRVKESDFSGKTKVTYVDGDIHTLLAMLKMKGVPITKLLNTILTDWITENIEDLTTLIKTDNKFL